MVLRRTPLYHRHLAAGARMVDFAGWTMPQQYTSVRDEHRAVRQAAGLFDVSHMGRFDIEGPGAGETLQRLVTNDASVLVPGRAQYTLLCNEDGGVIDDLVVYRAAGAGSGADWRVVVNAANRERDLTWLTEHAPAGVRIRDRSDELALLALQGPLAPQILPAEGVDLDALPYFGCTEGRVAGIDVMLSRTGYTGEDGFEIFVPSEEATAVWDALCAGGAVPCGLAARDVCRLEAGLRLYGLDMDEQTNPYEAGLGWAVKLDKGEFVGRDTLRQVKVAGVARSIAGVEGAGRAIPRSGASVWRGEERVGTVTSGTYSFWLEKGIGMAFIAAGAGPRGARLAVDVRGGRGEVEIVPLPFYRGSVRQPPRRSRV